MEGEEGEEGGKGVKTGPTEIVTGGYETLAPRTFLTSYGITPRGYLFIVDDED